MDILAHPNPALATPACDVDPANDPTLKPLAATMLRMMHEAPGIGLAAPQVGVVKRLIVFDLSEEGDQPMALCNPRIVDSSKECETDDEGCLSLPGISVPIERACKVVCEAQTLDGDKIQVEAEGLFARMLQHECDHLDGRLIIDRATPEERKAALRRYREAMEKGARPGETSI